MYQQDVRHVMQQVAKVPAKTPAAAVLAPVLLAMIRRVSDAVRQHQSVTRRAVRHTLVPENETAKAAAERRHQEIHEQVGFLPDSRRVASANTSSS
jgi:hypothetical protein